MICYLKPLYPALIRTELFAAEGSINIGLNISGSPSTRPICMVTKRPANLYICFGCLPKQLLSSFQPCRHAIIYRTFASTLPPREQQSATPPVAKEDDPDKEENSSKGTGAMSRRLADMTDKTINSGARTARKAIEEAGFSEDLKRQLEAKIQGSEFKSQDPAAFAQVAMPVCPNLSRQTLPVDQNLVWCWQRHPADRLSPTLDRDRDDRRCCSTDAHRCSQAHARASEDPETASTGHER